MSGRISIDNLSDNLKEMIANSGMTEEQIIELLENEEVIDSLKTNSKSIVGAINELFQSANNGKELIANAIGEPLNAEDTFSAMSGSINGLLSTFKTNMMNNGVTVNSGDKFKALIDKIATIADNEGKGIQISTGHFDITTLQPASEGMGVLTSNQLNFNPPLNFTPDRVILSIPKLQLGTSVGGDYANHSIDSEIHSSLNNRFTVYDENGKEINMYIGTVINDITAEGFVLNAGKNNTNYALTTPEGIDWLAIGVGEEDTALRDSLANILQDEGVSVTEEDDMANLITKVDEEFTKDNNTISGLENEINNGKNIIANAIGTPLTATDTFTEMGSDINGLLSTFKTNMMNNGITVNSGDKFKSLIDKIATMVEEGSGKGIQFASGITPSNFSNVQIDGIYFTCLNISLNFKPTILIVRNHANYGFYIEDFYPDNFSIVTVDNGYDEYRNVKNYEIDKGNNNYSIPIGYEIQKDTTYYWAVGVGEEDTTLRDSLASILTEEGVDVTEEDDMSALISKVDEEFDRQVVPQGTATINDVISGKTFINSTGQLLTGTASKGLATATGTVNVSSTLYTSKSFTINIDFTPTRLILIVPKVWYNSGVIEHKNVIVTNETTTLNAGPNENGTIKVSSMTSYSFNIQMSGLQIPECTITWIAIG